MNEKRYKLILYIIVLVIIGTIGIQFYWNYKNYHASKQQLINDVQLSLDNAVEKYYANLAKENTVSFSMKSNTEISNLNDPQKTQSILESIDLPIISKQILDSLNITVNNDKILTGAEADSFLKQIQKEHLRINDKKAVGFKQIQIFNSNHADIGNIKNLATKIIVSMTSETLDLKKLDTLLKAELEQKQLSITYHLDYNNSTKEIDSTQLQTVSKSPYLKTDKSLKIYFSDETKIILKRILTGVLISLLLVLAVISCLFYLLKIIKHQKELSEIKNDLISNITHEFKTPIATIGVALESIKDFNVIDDKEKTKSYLAMSSSQLSKLNTMVEKLLETATLDSENLNLKKESINLIDLFQAITEKYSITLDGKILEYNPSKDNTCANIDVFHFENAISNIIDNAIKYGGEKITITLSDSKNGVNISISDDGDTLTKANSTRIFEKFYRIPKGNQHDVKGFGIGLFYTKTIVEKHGGTIQLDFKNKQTSFKITLPNE